MDLQVDRELFPEGELLLQVSCRSSVIWGLPLAPVICWAQQPVPACRNIQQLWSMRLTCGGRGDPALPGAASL